MKRAELEQLRDLLSKAMKLEDADTRRKVVYANALSLTCDKLNEL